MQISFWLGLGVVAVGFVACSATNKSAFGDGDDDSPTTASSVTAAGVGGGDMASAASGVGGLNLTGSGGSGCALQCSSDLASVIDCHGNVVQDCKGNTACDPESLICKDACDVAKVTKQSVGCEYYATDMESYQANYCFAAFIANTWDTPVKINIELLGQKLPVANFVRIPKGQGQTVTYQPYDAINGLPAGEVAIAFLTGKSGGAPNCPVQPAASDNSIKGTGIGVSFRISTDVPVVAYQMNPFGGGSTAVTGASLLLPTSAWDTNYVGVNAYGHDLAPPSMNLVAAENNTKVTMVPVAGVQGGGGIPGAAQGAKLEFVLNKGQQAQISQNAELTGSIIQSDKPIGLMAGSACMRTPKGVAYCDHGEQMVPPVRALGSKYVGIQHRPRANEPGIWRVIGAVDGTQLSYSTPVGGPATLNQGQIAEFITGVPFVVESQSKDHPFLMFAYMAGSQWSQMSDKGGYGDVDFSVVVPPDQYLKNYVFFTDPTYPETNLVLIRTKQDDKFHPVTLDCAGVVSGWQPIGDYEWARVDLITGNFQNVGQCSTGRREMTSDAPFGVHVWGWGTPLTTNFTANVSYSYPAGMNIRFINDVVILPTPK